MFRPLFPSCSLKLVIRGSGCCANKRKYFALYFSVSLVILFFGFFGKWLSKLTIKCLSKIFHSNDSRPKALKASLGLSLFIAENSGKKTPSIIVKFKLWEFRKEF